MGEAVKGMVTMPTLRLFRSSMITLALCAGLLCGAPPARADLWAPPQVLTDSGTQSQVASSEDGSLLAAVWQSDAIQVGTSYTGGRMWTTPRQISPTGAVNDPKVSVRGRTIVVVYALRADPGGIRSVTSTDAGTTWTAPVAVSDDRDDFLPQVIGSADGTRVLLAWRHDDGSEHYDVQVASSGDSGQTWSPVRSLSAQGLQQRGATRRPVRRRPAGGRGLGTVRDRVPRRADSSHGRRREDLVRRRVDIGPGGVRGPSQPRGLRRRAAGHDRVGQQPRRRPVHRDHQFLRRRRLVELPDPRQPERPVRRVPGGFREFRRPACGRGLESVREHGSHLRGPKCVEFRWRWQLVAGREPQRAEPDPKRPANGAFRRWAFGPRDVGRQCRLPSTLQTIITSDGGATWTPRDGVAIW